MLKNKSYLVMLVALATVLTAHSCFRQKQNKDEIPRIDRAQLCLDGGASINEKTNECICASGLVWNGVRCDAVAQQVVQPPAPQLAENKSPEPAKNIEPVPVAEPQASEPVEVSEKVEPAPALATQSESNMPAPEWISELKRACRIATGSWLSKQHYCHCPDGKVLMGRRCRPMNGRMINDVCLRAVKKGSWQNGVCVCPEGEIFSPGRGGCVAGKIEDKVILRRICESTMNQGRWSENTGSCQCPANQILIGETCVNKSKLKSRLVCESDVYGGTWNAARKRCDCPDQKLWVNQSCLSAMEVDPESACLSGQNRGRWNKKRGLCDCPAGRRWLASKKICAPK